MTHANGLIGGMLDTIIIVLATMVGAAIVSFATFVVFVTLWEVGIIGLGLMEAALLWSLLIGGVLGAIFGFGEVTRGP